MPADIEPDLLKSAEALRQNVVGGLIEYFGKLDPQVIPEGRQHIGFNRQEGE